MGEPDATPQIQVVGDMERLALGPNDVLVVKCPFSITQETGERIRSAVRSQLGEDRKVLILSDGLELGVLTPSEA